MARLRSPLMNTALLHWNIVFAWGWILAGFLSGMVLGLFFHHEHWLGGYGSWMRRMYRLGHISFLGLGAMSGVRAQNAELLAAGLTLPGFIERSKVIASLPSLSLLTLAGLTPDHVDIEYREIADLRAAGDLPDDYDLVALTSLSAQI